MERAIICGEDEYRGLLFDKFIKSAVMTLIVKLLNDVENPDEIREVLIKTWYDKCKKEREEGMAEVLEMIDEINACGQDIPEHLSDENLKMQQEFFNGMMQELSCEIRALLKLPGVGE